MPGPIASRRLFGCLAVLFVPAAVQGQRVITTYAGTEWVFPGDGKPAINAPLGLLDAVGADGAGNVLVADPQNHVVIRIGSDGIARVIAGNTIPGFSGDGGLAVNASLNQPEAVTADRSGNIYIADGGNDRIRRVSPDGIITTFAGNGRTGFSGDGGPAIAAALNFPTDVQVDNGGNLYLIDTGNFRIRRVATNGVITTVVGTGRQACIAGPVNAAAAAVAGPSGLTFDSQGNLYFADFYCSWVAQVSPAGQLAIYAGNNQPATAGDGGPATSASLNAPLGVAMDRSNNLYIAEANACVIRRVDANRIISTVAGVVNQCQFGVADGPALRTTLFFPFGVVVDPAGSVYIADHGNERIRKLASAQITTVAGNGQFRKIVDGSAASLAYLYSPAGLAFDRSGNLYVADQLNNSIRKITPSRTVTTIAGQGPAGIGGNDGPATASLLDSPQGIAVGPDGTIYFSDTNNNSVRKISTSGTISVAAGRFREGGYSGDGGFGNNAALNGPSGLAFDSLGNLYIADQGNQAIRKLATNGIITTIAGGRAQGFGGDGGPAASGVFNNPAGLAVDSANNLYIADIGNNRVRKISSGGTLTTVAGSGRFASSGDGGLATAASIAAPSGVLTDSAGNLYITEAGGNRVRRVGADGSISTLAGTGAPGFAGDGGPATSALLDTPAGLAMDATGNLLIADSGNDRIRVVPAAQPSFQTSSQSVSITARSGGDLSDDQSVSLTPSLAGIPYSTSVVLSGGGQWLQLSPDTGTMPAVLKLRADPSSVAPGSYQAQVTINALNAVPPTRTITVNLQVTSAVPPKLSVDSPGLTFDSFQGAPDSSTQLNIGNSGSGQLNFTVTTSLASGSGWLNVSPLSGTASPGKPVGLTVTASPGAVTSGTFTATIHIASASGTDSVDVPVILSVAKSQKVILLSQTGMTFTAVANAGAVAPQRLQILNAGVGGLNWSAQTLTLSGGQGWLSLSGASGSVQTALTDASPLDVQINPTGLAAGDYYGEVQVSSPGASNSPQFVTVILNVLPAGTVPPPEVKPASLVFMGAAGASPGSQTLQIPNPAGVSLSYSSQRFTDDGSPWLTTVPSSAVITSAAGSMIVQPDYTNLAPGTHRGTVTVQFADGTVRNVGVLAIALAGGHSIKQSLDASCADPGLKVDYTTISDGFSVPATQPTLIEVQVTQCSSPVTNGIVQALFSNGDSTVALDHVGNGRWHHNWQTNGQPGSSVKLYVQALLYGTSISYGGNGKTLSGTVAKAARVPQVADGGVANGASFAREAPVAPGTIVTIFGSQLADGTASANQTPLDSTLGGTQVFLSDRALPLLYTSDGQINALIPYDVNVDTPLQLRVRRGTAESIGLPVSVASAQPAIFTQDFSGKGPGVIVNAANQLVTAANPVKAGDAIVIYCAGLGAVNPAVPTGAGAPIGGPLSSTVSPVNLKIGTSSLTPIFAGLTPGSPGLYQINAVVPSGVQTGNTVPVTITTSGQTSVPVTIAIRP